MRILVAGATGAIGRPLLPLLTAAGHEVWGLARAQTQADSVRAAGATPVFADVLDFDALTEAVRTARPDVVMHQLTSLSAGDLVANAELRRTGTRNLVDAALKSGVRRIIAQSISWAYAPGEDPAVENTALDVSAPSPRATTVAGVAALEDAVAEAPESVVLRYGTFYGPGTWYTSDGAMARRAALGQLPATPDVSSFVHIQDAAEAARAALAWPTGPVNICDDDPAPATQWAPLFCAAVGAPQPPAPGAPRQPWARGASNAYARTSLGWTPSHPTWREGFTG